MNSSFKLFWFLFLFLFSNCVGQTRLNQTINGTSTVFHAGVHTLTQFGLNDGKTRYRSYIDDFINRIVTSKWPDYSQGSGCHTSYAIYGSRAFNKKVTLDYNTLSLEIGTSNNIIIKADFTIDCSVPVYYKWKKRIIFCFGHTICNGNVQVHLGLHAEGQVQFGMSKGAITIDSKLLTLTQTAFHWSGCSIPSWISWLVNVNALVQAAVKEALTKIANSLADHIVVQRSFSPTKHIYIDYTAKQFVSVPENHISFFSDGSIIIETAASNFRVNYTLPVDSDEASQQVPDYPNDLLPMDDKGNGAALQQTKLASEVFTGFIQAGNLIDAYNMTHDVLILDAHFLFHAFLDTISATVPRDGVFGLSIPDGMIIATCHNPNDPPVVMLEATFTDFNGWGVLNTTKKTPTPGLFPQILTIDTNAIKLKLVAPVLPLPEDLVHQIFNATLKIIPQVINVFLAKHPIYLPSDIAPFVPNPEIILHHRSGCCKNEWGWASITSYPTSQSTAHVLSSSRISHTLYSKSYTTPPFNLFSSNSSQNNFIFLIRYTDISGKSVDDCTITGPNYQAIRYEFSDTNGKCAHAINYQDGDMFYQLSMTPNGNLEKFSLCNSANCTNCQTQTNFEVCYGDGQILLPKDLTCIAIQDPPSDSTYYLGTFINNTKCNIETPYITFIHLGEPNKCLPSGDGSFHKLQLFSNGSIVLFYECEISNCTKCEVVLASHWNETCTVLGPNSFRVFTDSELPLCKNKNIPRNKNIPVVLIICLIFGICIFLIILTIFILCCKRKFKRKPRASELLNVNEDSPLLHSSMTSTWKERITNKFYIHPEARQKMKENFSIRRETRKNIFNFIVDILTLVNFEELPHRKKHLILIFPFISLIISYYSWIEYNPWENLTLVSPADLGLDSDAFEMQKAKTMFNRWSREAKSVLLFSAIFSICITIILLLFRRPISIRIRGILHNSVILLGAFIPMCVLLVPLYFTKILGTVYFNPDYNSIQADQPLLYHYLNTFVSYSFVGIVLSYAARLIMYFLHSLWAVYFGFIFYVTYNYSKWEEIYDSKKYVLGAYRICLVLITLLSPVSCIQPVIIVYQQMGVDYTWLLGWFVFWGLSLFFGIHWCYCTYKLTFWKLCFQILPFCLIYLGFTFYIIETDSTFLSGFGAVGISFPIFNLVSLFISWCSLGYTTAHLIDSHLTIISPSIKYEILNNEEIKEEIKEDIEEDEKNVNQCVEQSSKSKIINQFLSKCFDIEPDCPTPSFRRFFLIIGILFFSILLVYIYQDLQISALDRFNAILQKIDPNLVWPSGTFLDGTFGSYDSAQLQQYWSLQSSVIVFGLSLMTTLIFPKRVTMAYVVSALIGFVGAISLFSAAVIPGFHNYELSAAINTIFPPCGKKFNHAVTTIVGNIVGTFAAILFSVDTLPILIFLSQALVRSCYLIISKSHNTLFRSIKPIMIVVSMVSPFVTMLGFVTIYQVLGNQVILALLFMWWIIPFITILSFLSVPDPKVKTLNISILRKLHNWTYRHQALVAYIMWAITYFAFLLGLILYIVHANDLWEEFRDTLTKVELYLEIVCEFFLSNVIITDLFFLLTK